MLGEVGSGIKVVMVIMTSFGIHAVREELGGKAGAVVLLWVGRVAVVPWAGGGLQQ